MVQPKVYTFLCGCFAALGSFLYGYDLGVIAGVLVAPDFLRTVENPDADYTGFITSSLLLGAFVGCIPASFIADRFSRRSAILVMSIVFLFGGSMQAGAGSRQVMLAGRFFAGVGIGGLTMLVPMYQAEISHPSIRGMVTALQQFFLGIGVFIASFVAYGMELHHHGTALQWRFPLALQLLPAIPLALLIFLFPESPRWLMLKGHENRAIEALARLHSRGDTTDVFVQTEAKDLKEDVARIRRDEHSKGTWSFILKDYQTVRKFMLGIVCQFSVQMTGVSVILYYSPKIFAAAGFNRERQLLFQSIANVFAITGEVCCILFIDKSGRRWPMIICNAAAGAIFIICTVLQALYPADSSRGINLAASYAFVALTWIFQFFFSFGIGSLSWVYPVEIMGTAVRAKGVAVANMACWLSSFMMAQVAPKAFDSVGWRFYIVFAVCSVGNAITIYLFFPETKGYTLEEMDDHFEQTPLVVPLGRRKQLISATAREMAMRIDEANECSEGNKVKRDNVDVSIVEDA